MTSHVWSVLFSLVVLQCNCAYSTSSGNTIIETSAGAVSGFYQQALGKAVTTFLGIPYAQPPVGELRFQKPVPLHPWPDVRNATRFSMSCIQSLSNPFLQYPGSEIADIKTEISEDCLYLNVWSPRGSEGMDVIVWSHGGGFNSGSTSVGNYDGIMLSAFTNTVVVSVNYRLGMLGFAYFGTDNMTGNIGFFDQAMALRWVKTNIAAFGGNPNSVTFIGQSAGAAAVTALVISPIAQGLFKNAVAMSGVINAPWGTYSVETALNMTKGVASLLGCQQHSNDSTSKHVSSSVVQCLRNLPANVFVIGFDGRRWGPTIDGELVSHHPLKALRSGCINFNGSILIGATKDDGSFIAMAQHSEKFNKFGTTSLKRCQVFDVISKHFPSESPTLRTLIQFLYTDWENPNDEITNTQLAVDFLSDVLFVCPSKFFASALSDFGADVFFYNYAHRALGNPRPSWTGVSHIDDVEFWFGHPLNDTTRYSREERDLSQRMMTHLANFARTGNPSLQDFVWQPFTTEEHHVVLLNTSNYTTYVGPRSQHCEFWNNLASTLHIGSADMYSSTREVSCNNQTSANTPDDQTEFC